MQSGHLPRLIALLLWVLIPSTLIGGLIGYSRADGVPTLNDILGGALTGIIIGFCGVLGETYVFSNSSLRFVRRLRPLLLLAMRALFYSIVIVFGLLLPAQLFGTGLRFTDPQFLEIFLLSALISFVFSTLIEISRQLGAEATISLLTGRYNRPRLEDRVILIADLVGSTSLAEQIGELQFHSFLQEVALDLAGPVERSGGSVHRYVGDAVIVTWPQDRGSDDAACLTCALNMQRTLADRAMLYKAQFGQVPKLRIALHCGRVAAGEIGDWKKEISLLGDAMNTVARIESAARELGADVVLSDRLVQRFPEDLRHGLAALPSYRALGKRAPLQLWAPSERVSITRAS